MDSIAQAVQLISKLIKSKSYNTKPAVSHPLSQTVSSSLVSPPLHLLPLTLLLSHLLRQVLRTFLQLQLHSVGGPVGVRGGRGDGGGGGTDRDRTVVGKGSKLTRKQRKV